MKPETTESAWTANPPSAPQASRIVSTVSIAGGLIFGVIGLQPLVIGGDFGFVNMLFAVAAIHLILQATASAISWKVGALFATISMAAMFVVAISFIVQLDFRSPAVFSVSAMVSIVAAKIQIDQTKLTRCG